MTRRDYEALVEVILDTERGQGQSPLPCMWSLLNALQHHFPNFDREKFESTLNTRRHKRA